MRNLKGDDMINIVIDGDKLMIASSKKVTAEDLIALGKLMGVIEE